MALRAHEGQLECGTAVVVGRRAQGDEPGSTTYHAEYRQARAAGRRTGAREDVARCEGCARR